MLIRFYGFDEQTLLKMDIKKVNEYLQAMNIIKAREFLELTQISTWPKMKEQDRNRIYKQKYKEANFDNKKRAATVQDIARIIGK